MHRIKTYVAVRNSDLNDSKKHKPGEIHSFNSPNGDYTLQNKTSPDQLNDCFTQNSNSNQISTQSVDSDYGEFSCSDISDGDLKDYVNDIEDVLQDLNRKEKNLTPNILPPVIRYSKKWTLSVTELSSQLWCERNLELTLITGIRPENELMKQGTARHEVLEKLDHEMVEVTTTSSEEDLGIKMLNSIILLDKLMQTGKCREIWIFGSYKNYVLRGIVDQLEIVKVGGSKFVKISDTKTRRVKNEPSQAQKLLSALQIQTYYMLLNNLRNGIVDFDKLYNYSELDFDKHFVIPELKDYKCLRSLEKYYLKSFNRLPEVYTVMEISYEFEGNIFSVDEVKLEFKNLINTIEYCLEFWEGNRSSEIVEPHESWKCKFCHLLDKCNESPYKKLQANQSQN